MTTTTNDDRIRHAGNIWRYQDARGVAHIGHLHHVSDFGGSDVPYTFKDCATGELSVVSGQRLKSAAPCDQRCEIREALIAEWSR